METMNIALPESLKQFVQTQVNDGGYSSASEYVRELIRKDLQVKKAGLEQELLKGLHSGPATSMTKADWNRARSKVRTKAKRASKSNQ
jgi:antitoxin ParD1/3/4